MIRPINHSNHFSGIDVTRMLQEPINVGDSLSRVSKGLQSMGGRKLVNASALIKQSEARSRYKEQVHAPPSLQAARTRVVQPSLRRGRQVGPHWRWVG